MTPPKNNEQPVVSQEEMTVVLPAAALGTLGELLSSQRGGVYGAAENSSSMITAAATQNEPFPCFKKSVWGDQIMVRISRQHAVPHVA